MSDHPQGTIEWKLQQLAYSARWRADRDREDGDRESAHGWDGHAGGLLVALEWVKKYKELEVSV